MTDRAISLKRAGVAHAKPRADEQLRETGAVLKENFNFRLQAPYVQCFRSPLNRAEPLQISAGRFAWQQDFRAS